MKFLRCIVATLLFAGFSLAQLPQMASCVMVSNVKTVGCHMPCCGAMAKSAEKMPMPTGSRCAVKTDVSRDVALTAFSIPDFSASQWIAGIVVDGLHLRLVVKRRYEDMKDKIRDLLLPPKLATRGPPADVHLLFA